MVEPVTAAGWSGDHRRRRRGAGVHDLSHRLDDGVGRRVVLQPVQELVEDREVDGAVIGHARRVVGRVVLLGADLVEHERDPAAAVLGGGRDRCLQVRERGGCRGRVVEDGARRERVLGGQRLREERSGSGAVDVDTAGGAAGRIAAALDDLLGGRIVGTLGVGEADRPEPAIDQVLAVVADLVDLGLVVRGRLQVDVVHGVAADLLAGRVERAHLWPGHRPVGADGVGDDVEGAVHAVRLEAVQVADAVLVLVGVVEGQRDDRLELEHLRLGRFRVAGQVGGEEVDGRVLLQRERPGVDGAVGGRRGTVGRVVRLVEAPAAGVVGRVEGDRDRSRVHRRAGRSVAGDRGRRGRRVGGFDQLHRLRVRGLDVSGVIP